MPDAEREGAPVVYIVDDDDHVRASLTWLFTSIDLEVQAFASAAAFLGAYAGGPGCLLLDVRMPGMTGLELQAELKRRGIALPVIFITGHGDVPMAMRAVRDGALGFFEKPFPHQEVIELVHEALQRNRDERAERGDWERVDRRLSDLTAREREIADLLVAGLANRQIAEKLGISVRTVEVHRASIMRKTNAKGLAELVRMVLRWRQGGGGGASA
jgi:two-component system, LuxR family, response regulator FixJ